MTQVSLQLPLPEFFDPHVLEDPAAWYEQAHATAPIVQTADGTHLVLSYALVAEAAERPEDFSSSFGPLMAGRESDDDEILAIAAQGWPVVDTMLTADDPVHARFRRLVSLAFSYQRVAALEAHIRSIAVGLLDAMPTGTPFDFLPAFAVPLPVTVIAEQIGMERSAAARVKRWSDASTTRHSGLASRERELECAQEMLSFQQFVKAKIDERRSMGNTEDLLGGIVNAQIEGERALEDMEIMSVIQQLMVAGNETTTSTLAGGLRLLCENPDQLALVRADPALIPVMIEEMLRLLSPTAGIWRIATRDSLLGDTPIAAGDRLMLRFAAANRDPEVFADPNRFDIRRSNVKKHIAFGRGPHICIGNMLARKELAVSFEEILHRFQTIELAHGASPPQHVRHKLLHGLGNLQIMVRT
jgi:cytochrome P450